MRDAARRPVLICRLCGFIVDPNDDELAYMGHKSRPISTTMKELNGECPEMARIEGRGGKKQHQWIGRVL